MAKRPEIWSDLGKHSFFGFTQPKDRTYLFVYQILTADVERAQRLLTAAGQSLYKEYRVRGILLLAQT